VSHRWELRSIDPTSSAVRQLGDMLYNLRIRAGLTQQQLAALTGGRWSRSHIGRVENGDAGHAYELRDTVAAKALARLDVAAAETSSAAGRGRPGRRRSAADAGRLPDRPDRAAGHRAGRLAGTAPLDGGGSGLQGAACLAAPFTWRAEGCKLRRGAVASRA
jgi:transcriptional regulator with XRE-family HTH domain